MHLKIRMFCLCLSTVELIALLISMQIEQVPTNSAIQESGVRTAQNKQLLHHGYNSKIH